MLLSFCISARDPHTKYILRHHVAFERKWTLNLLECNSIMWKNVHNYLPSAAFVMKGILCVENCPQVRTICFLNLTDFLIQLLSFSGERNNRFFLKDTAFSGR